MIVVVAGTYTQRKNDGYINVQTAIRYYNCNSGSEGVGMFVDEMSKLLPNHDLHIRPVRICFEENNIVQK